MDIAADDGRRDAEEKIIEARNEKGLRACLKIFS